MKKLILLVTLVTAFVSGGTFAQETKSPAKPGKIATKQVTPEQRRNMAAMHEKMAACLRSDKSMGECHTEMRSQCKEMMGKEGCPMMGEMGGMMGKGMHPNGMPRR